MADIPCLAGPGGDSPQSDRRGRRRQQQARSPYIPPIAKILESMAKLPQLVAIGIITPAQCNSIHAVLKTMLDELRGTGKAAAAAQILPQTLKDAIRHSPELLDFMAAWLSEDQLREILDDEDSRDES